jgi:hypothetical protein
MLEILRKYTEDSFGIVEYTKNGIDVSHVVKTPIVNNETGIEIETIDEKIARLEQNNQELKAQVEQDNLIQFEVLATIYEELLASKGSA